MANQYRYSRQSFNRSTLTAVGLTLIVCLLVWLFSRLLGFYRSDLITAISGLIFFSFCSAAMIWRYWRNDIVVAIRPDGLFDARYSTQAIPWDDIKDVRLGRAENDFQLDVYLWPGRHHVTDAGPAFSIDLQPLDVPAQQVVDAIVNYKPITLEES